MKLVIDIDEETYKMCKRLLGDADGIERAIANGIPYKEQFTDSGYKELKLALKERPTGYWKNIGLVTWHGCTAFECSNCHKCDERDETETFVPFCKYCGAIMRKRGRE